jgi:predicted deacylase
MQNQTPLIDQFDQSVIEKLEPGVWHSFRLAYGARIGGEALTFTFHVFRGRTPGARLTITSGVHGDEFEGPRALWNLTREHLRADRGTLVVTPVVNIPAYEAGTRTSPLDGMNLARVFPGKEDGLPSERLAYTLFHQIVMGSDLLVDLHSGGTNYLHCPLMGFYDQCGETGQRSLAAAQSTGWEILWAAPHRAGVLSFEAVKHGIPAIGTEVGGAGRCFAEDVAIYPKTFHNLLVHQGLIDGDVTESTEMSIIDGDWYLSPTAGFLENEVSLHQQIQPGLLLGRVYDHTGCQKAEIRALHHGIVVGLRTFPTIQAGEWSVFVGVPRRTG